MKYELWYSIVVRDRRGKIISREQRRSHSLLKQWNQLAYLYMSATALNITDTGGTPRSIGADGMGFWINSSIGDDDAGIIIGTGNTAVALDDYAVETKIVEGAGAGQMNYLACLAANPVVAAPICSFEVSRSVVNNSGSQITVREAGLYFWLDGTPRYGCAARDVFNTPQDVPHGGSIIVNWTIRVSV